MMKITSGLPPWRSRAKSADRPMDEKNTSMKASCKGFSNWKFTPCTVCTPNSTSAATRPPATGSGMLKSCKNLILRTSQLPSSSTSTAAISV